MKEERKQFSPLAKGFILLAVIFFAMQLFSRPFFGPTADAFGFLGGISLIVALVIYFKDKDKKIKK